MRVLFVNKKYYTLIFLGIILVIFVLVYAVTIKQNTAQVSGNYRDDIPIYSVESEDKSFALTFDCAWGADDIPQILDILDKHEVKSTFFIVGLWAEKYPEMIEIISKRGHEIANHGYSHAHMAQIPEAKIKEEIVRCNETLEKISGDKITLFRPPYGEYNATTIKVAKMLNMQSIQWDVDSLDWKKNMSADDIYNRVTKKVTSGAIILFHNDTLHTVEVLPSILENLTQNGYKGVSVSELLLDGDYIIRYDGRQMRVK